MCKMSFLNALVLFVLLGYLIHYYFTRTFKYWKSRNIPGPRPLPFFGNVKDFVLRKYNAAELNKQIYDEYPNEKVVGIFRMTSPILIIRDLDVAKKVLVTDFEYFEDRGIEFSKKGLGANLFHADSEIWKPLRIFLSPLFTTVKLKNMFHLIVERSDLAINHLMKITVLQKEHNVHPLVQKFSMSSILACAFGLDIAVDSEVLLQKMIKMDQMTLSRRIARDFYFSYPSVLKKLFATDFPTEVINFFIDLVKDVTKARNGMPSNRKDFIDLILEAKNQGNILKSRTGDDTVELTDEVIAAQAFIFYIAGYESNATTITFLLYELAMNPQIQEKLITEVDEILHRHNGKITYELIAELSYMEMVLNETLRKYPILDIQRRANADYSIPGTNIKIEKGTVIFVPTLGIGYDEKYYPNPTKFDPERFSPENISKRPSFAFIPFGAGPRFCIGMLFARIQSHVYLMKLLSNFRVETSKNTPPTIVFDPNRIIIAAKEGIYLNLIPRKPQNGTN